MTNKTDNLIKRTLLIAFTLIACSVQAEDWKYVKSIQIPRPYTPIFAAITPTGDCVVATFNNTRSEKPVNLPVIYIHKPLSESPGFYVVCTNAFPSLRGYSGVAVDSAGNYYVAGDTGGDDSWIRKFKPDGKPDISFGINGEVRPNRRVLGLDLAGNKLFTTYGFAELVCLDARTGRVLGQILPPPGEKPPIRDVAVDATREVIYGVANGAAWVWRGGKFNNLSGYKLERLTQEMLKNPKAGEGVYFDAFGDRLLMPVSDLATLFAVDARGNATKSEIAGADGLVQSPSDAVLLADGETLFIPDMKTGPSGECLIHVMKRVSAVTKTAGSGEVTLPSLADAGLLKASAGDATGASSAMGTELAWKTSFTAAFDEAKRINKPVLLYARNSAAKRCQELESGFLKSSEFVQLANKTVPFYFDVSSDPKLAQQLGIFRVPFIAIYKPDGERVDMWLGRFNTADVLTKLEQVTK
ncbi:MAG: thioredoxin family protein [Candidatus Sumerlaeaceae bacterium]